MSRTTYGPSVIAAAAVLMFTASAQAGPVSTGVLGIDVVSNSEIEPARWRRHYGYGYYRPYRYYNFGYNYYRPYRYYNYGYYRPYRYRRYGFRLGW